MSQSTATVMLLLVNYELSPMGIFRHGKVLIHVHSLTCTFTDMPIHVLSYRLQWDIK